jgi:hypothetical protein
MGRKHGLSVKIQLDLFDKMVKSILLYRCEVWGFSNNDIIEKGHLKFCKLLLHLKSSTPSYMIYGELGRYQLRFLGSLPLKKNHNFPFICIHFKLPDRTIILE